MVPLYVSLPAMQCKRNRSRHTLALVLLLLLCLVAAAFAWHRMGGKNEEIRSLMELEAALANGDTVLFYAEWCMHCKRVLQTFRELARQGHSHLRRVNAPLRLRPEHLARFGVDRYPSIVRIRGGSVVRCQGQSPQAIVDFSRATF